MNVWSWKSAAIIWIFAYFWLQAWAGCAPARESFSQSMRSEKEAKAAARAAEEKEALFQEQLIALGMLEKPPEEPTFWCSFLGCETEE